MAKERVDQRFMSSSSRRRLVEAVVEREQGERMRGLGPETAVLVEVAVEAEPDVGVAVLLVERVTLNAGGCDLRLDEAKGR